MDIWAHNELLIGDKKISEYLLVVFSNSTIAQKPFAICMARMFSKYVLKIDAK